MPGPHDHGAIPADPVRFTEAINALRDKVPMTRALFDTLTEAEREFAFSVANVTQADLVTEVLEAMEIAVRDGITFEEFQAGPTAERLSEAWGGENPPRLETIFRTSVVGAYNEGRYRQMTAPTVKRLRNFWRYDAIEDSRLRDCPICSPCAGVILPSDHAWWQKHYPILHPSCRCVATPLTQEEAEAEGITRSPPSSTPATGFGQAPSVRGSDWSPSPDDYPDSISAVLGDRLNETG